MKINYSKSSSLNKTSDYKTKKSHIEKTVSSEVDKTISSSSSAVQDTSIEDFVSKIAKQKFGKYSNSSILATAIKLVSDKIATSESAIDAIKEKSDKT